MTSLLSVSRSIIRAVLLGFCSIISCICAVRLSMSALSSLIVDHRTWNSNSSSSSNKSSTFDLSLTNISLNCADMSAGRICSCCSLLLVSVSSLLCSLVSTILKRVSNARQHSSESILFCLSTSIRTCMAWVPTSSLNFFDRDFMVFSESRRSSISNDDCKRSHNRSICKQKKKI